jgi:hypothetical protein
VPFVAAHPEAYVGLVVGDGHCVAYVRAAANAPHTSLWIEGRPVYEVADTLTPGTAIASFNRDGRYGNATDGSSHAALFVSGDEAGGIAVYDQWRLHPVSRRIIRAKGGKGPAADDADAFAVIEVSE